MIAVCAKLYEVGPYMSLRHDGRVIKIYGFHDDREYFVLLPEMSGRRLREMREKAADAIERAMAEGRHGEVDCG